MVEFRRADLPHEQYVFFFIDVFAGSLKHGEPWWRGDKDDAVARDAFQVTMATSETPIKSAQVGEVLSQSGS